MTRNPDPINAEISPTARTRVRVPGRLESIRIFPGWGPGLGR